jgi:Domain of unknown function (DUF4156)
MTKSRSREGVGYGRSGLLAQPFNDELLIGGFSMSTVCRLVVFAAIMLLSACSAIQTTPAGAVVELVNDKPQGSCRALGEIVGSQGNFFTGDFTSNKNLMIGARNDLRNQAANMGGNLVHVQNVSNASADRGLGTSNTTVVGMVYNCQRQ